jgi:hypothetical protein
MTWIGEDLGHRTFFDFFAMPHQHDPIGELRD